MNRLCFAACSGAIAAFSTAASAAVLVSANFNSPTYTDGALNTNTDTTTAGQDGWLNTSGGGTNNVTVSNTATNGIVSLTTTGQDVRKLGPTGTVINSGSAFLQADINLSAAQATGDYFIHMGDGGTSNFYARVFAKSATGGYQLAMTTSSGGTPLYGATLSFGTTYTLLARYDFVSGAANDTGAIFINPTTADGSGDTAYIAAVTSGTDATQIASMNLRQGTAANAATVSSIDNMSVSGTLTTVPEPASLAVLGLGGLTVLRRRRA